MHERGFAILVNAEGIRGIRFAWPPSSEVFRLGEAILPALGLLQALADDFAESRRKPARGARSKPTIPEATEVVGR